MRRDCLKFATSETFFSVYLSIYRHLPPFAHNQPEFSLQHGLACTTRAAPSRRFLEGLTPFFREYDMMKQVLAAVLAFAAAASMAAVDVNKATVADLDSIKGIGPGTSAKIMEARQKAPFKNWEDLISRVPGIGDKRAAKLSSEGLTVQGEGYKGVVAIAKPDKADKVSKAKEAKAPADDRKPVKP
jgi:competence protein ComEA